MNTNYDHPEIELIHCRMKEGEGGQLSERCHLEDVNWDKKNWCISCRNRVSIFQPEKLWKQSSRKSKAQEKNGEQ